VRSGYALAAIVLLASLSKGGVAPADEGGVSFWLPGQFASFAAIAPAPGFSLPLQTYFYTGSASGDQVLNRGGKLRLGLDTTLVGQMITPTYTPDIRLLGGRPSVSLTIFPGYNEVSADASLGMLTDAESDSILGFGDLYPMAQLFWDGGVHNGMAYLTGDIPVGAYNPNRLANLGIGHPAIDAGGAYTYDNPSNGWEFSATAGLTYNFENTETDYRNGIDSHLDLGLSKSLGPKFFVGAVGYAYVQLTPDQGQPAALGAFESRTFAVGPQAGYTFDVAGASVDANLRGYYEFAVENRTEGASVFLAISVQP
jgi:hypothetical protein